MTFSRIKRGVATLAAVAVLGGAAAVTAGAVGSDPESIAACVADQNGLVRIVGEGEACRPNEHPLSWPAAIPAGDGDSGSGAVAYAHVDWRGLDTANSSNVNAITTPYPGVVCFDLVDGITPHVATAQVELNVQTFATASVSPSRTASCPEGFKDGIVTLWVQPYDNAIPGGTYVARPWVPATPTPWFSVVFH